MSAVSAAMMRAVARKAALTNYVRYYINNAPIVVAASSSSLAKKKGIRSTSSAASDRHARSHSVHLAASMPQPAVAVAYDYYPDFDDVDCNDDDEEDGLRGHASSRASFCSVGVRGANSSSHVGISTNSYDDDYSHRNRPSLPRAFGGLTPPPPPISSPRPIIGSTTRSGGSGGGGGGGGGSGTGRHRCPKCGNVAVFSHGEFEENTFYCAACSGWFLVSPQREAAESTGGAKHPRQPPPPPPPSPSPSPSPSPRFGDPSKDDPRISMQHVSSRASTPKFLSGCVSSLDPPGGMLRPRSGFGRELRRSGGGCPPPHGSIPVTESVVFVSVWSPCFGLLLCLCVSLSVVCHWSRVGIMCRLFVSPVLALCGALEGFTLLVVYRTVRLKE